METASPRADQEAVWYEPAPHGGTVAVTRLRTGCRANRTTDPSADHPADAADPPGLTDPPDPFNTAAQRVAAAAAAGCGGRSA
jgi:hypothetical protein